MAYDIMINSIYIEHRRKTYDEGEGVDFGQNFDDVIFEQPLSKFLTLRAQSFLLP